MTRHRDRMIGNHSLLRGYGKAADLLAGGGYCLPAVANTEVWRVCGGWQLREERTGSGWQFGGYSIASITT